MSSGTAQGSGKGWLKTPGLALAGLLLVTGVLRLLWAAALGLGNDEAYYYLFSVHRDWSYFDHPPMVAVVESFGVWLSGGSVAPLALRSGFILLFAGSTVLMARLAGRLYGAWAGVVAAVILNASAHISLAAGAFVIPDGPLLFFWLLTLERLSICVRGGSRDRPGLWPWVVVGLAWGGALLSKYHAFLLPAGFLLYVLGSRSARKLLKSPGPYLAVLVGMAVFSPVLAWNANHGWISFRFQAGRAFQEGGIRPESVLMFLAGQSLYLLPWIWVLLVAAAVRALGRLFQGGRGEEELEGDRFLICQSLPVMLLFLGVSAFKPVLPHWSLVGFLGLMPLAARDWVSWWLSQHHQPGRLLRRCVVLSGLLWLGAALLACHAKWGVFQEGAEHGLALIAPDNDPSRDMFGWDQVVKELRERDLLGHRRTFLFTSQWYESAHLAHALRSTEAVLCYSGSRAAGFADWSRPEDWIGWDGLLLVAAPRSTEPHAYDRYFDRIDPLEEIVVKRAGGILRIVRVYRCVGQKVPFPFTLRGVAR